MSAAERSWRLLDRAVLDLDAAETRLRRALEQRDRWDWELSENGEARVRNIRTGQSYLVSRDSCTCGDWVWRGSRTGVHCKHMSALALMILERGL